MNGLLSYLVLIIKGRFVILWLLGGVGGFSSIRFKLFHCISLLIDMDYRTKYLLFVVKITFFIIFIIHTFLIALKICNPEVPELKISKRRLRDIEFPLCFKVCFFDIKNSRSVRVRGPVRGRLQIYANSEKEKLTLQKF